MNTNKKHIVEKYGAFYTGTSRTLDTKRKIGTNYVKIYNRIWCPSNNVYMLKCALKKIGITS